MCTSSLGSRRSEAKGLKIIESSRERCHCCTVEPCSHSSPCARTLAVNGDNHLTPLLPWTNKLECPPLLGLTCAETGPLHEPESLYDESIIVTLKQTGSEVCSSGRIAASPLDV